MYYNEKVPRNVVRKEYAEWRGRILKEQKDSLQYYEDTIGVPQAALVRMALANFLPKIKNDGFSPTGIKNAYIESNDFVELVL